MLLFITAIFCYCSAANAQQIMMFETDFNIEKTFEIKTKKRWSKEYEIPKGYGAYIWSSDSVLTKWIRIERDGFVAKMTY
ncbi:MAG: hypothetical protein ABII90_08930 [Bacteroidota bacterium]